MRRLPVLAFAAALAACPSPTAFVVQGDASSVAVGYGGDIADAAPVAQRHCARFERVPHLLDHQADVAYFSCAKP